MRTRRPHRTFPPPIRIHTLTSHSRAIALNLKADLAAVAAAADSEPAAAATRAQNVIAVARLAILRARAPRRLVVEAEVEAGAEAATAAVAEVATVISGVVVAGAKSPGMCVFVHTVRVAFLMPSAGAVISYTCGGVGHLSRDCVQGSKCYNCSGIVRPRPA